MFCLTLWYQTGLKTAGAATLLATIIVACICYQPSLLFLLHPTLLGCQNHSVFPLRILLQEWFHIQVMKCPARWKMNPNHCLPYLPNTSASPPDGVLVVTSSGLLHFFRL